MAKKRKKYQRVKIRLIEGLPVVDAGKKMKLRITRADVSGAKKSDPANCAAARAISRELKVDARVHMTRTYIKMGPKNKQKWVRFITPQAISREITAFDRGAQFEPGDYTLIPAPPSNQLGMHKVTGEHSHHKTTGEKRPHHVTASVREWKHRR